MAWRSKYTASLHKHDYHTSLIMTSCCWCSVAQLCPTLCDPMDCSMPGSSVLPCLPEFAQIHIHLVSDAIYPSYPLPSSSPFAFSLSQHQSFPMSWLFASDGQSIGASTSVLTMNIEGWFPLELTGFISLHPRDSQESSPTPQFKTINSSALSFPYSPTLISIRDHWKNHSLDWTDLFWKTNVSAF